MAGSTRRSLLKSWNGKILLFAVLIAFIPLAIFGVIAYLRAQSALQAAYAQKFENTAQIINFNLNTWFGEQIKFVSILTSDSRVQSLQESDFKPVLENALKANPALDFLIVIGLDGKEIYNSANTAGPEGLQVLADRPYFLAAKGGSVFINNPVVSRTTGNTVFVISAPIQKDGQIVGVLAAPIRVGTVNEMIASAYAGDTGEAYIISDAGVFLTPSRFAEELKASGREDWDVLKLTTDSEASKKAIAGETGVLAYANYRGKNVLGAYAPVSIHNTRWALIIEQETSEIYQAIFNLRNLLILIGLAIIVVVVTISTIVSRQMTKPIITISEVTNKLAEGDIDQQVTLTGEDEIGLMAEAFRGLIGYMREMSGTASQIAGGDLTADINPRSHKDMLGISFKEMIANLRKQVSELAEAARNLGTASSDLANASDQAGRATHQIATTIQQVASGTSQQASSIATTSSSVEEMTRTIDGVAHGAQDQANAAAKATAMTNQLSNTIQQVIGNAQTVTRQAQSAAEAASDGQDKVQQTIQGILSIRTSVDQSAKAIEEMGKRSDEIGMIVETIRDIASQTNLLALNAAIEAARAGEHGKGFAVVADEVRKLAERSASATREITSLISGIQATVSEAVSAMRQSGEQVAHGVDQANASGNSLTLILESIEQVTDQAEQANQAAQMMNSAANELVNSVDSVSAVIEENTAATEEMSASSTEVSQAIENIASISEENSAAVEEVSASAEEMSAQVQEVSEAARSLANLAEGLDRIVSQFKL